MADRWLFPGSWSKYRSGSSPRQQKKNRNGLDYTFFSVVNIVWEELATNLLRQYWIWHRRDS